MTKLDLISCAPICPNACLSDIEHCTLKKKFQRWARITSISIKTRSRCYAWVPKPKKGDKMCSSSIPLSRKNSNK